MLVIISKVLVVFIYIGVGFFACKGGLIRQDSVPALNMLVLNIASPCLLISSITSRRLNDSLFRNTLITFFLSIAFFILMSALTLWISRRTGMEDKAKANVLAVGMTACNSGFMGFPIAQSVFGDTVFYYVVIQNIAFNLYLYIMAIMQFNFGLKKFNGKVTFRKAILPFINVLTISAVVSIIMLFARIKLPEYALNIVTTLANVCIPVSMIIVGIKLTEGRFTDHFTNPKILFTSLMKLIIVPVITLLIMLPLPVAPVVKLASVLCMTFPTAVISVALAARENRDSGLMAECVATSTLISIVTLPVWMIILTKLFL